MQFITVITIINPSKQNALIAPDVLDSTEIFKMATKKEIEINAAISQILEIIFSLDYKSDKVYEKSNSSNPLVRHVHVASRLKFDGNDDAEIAAIIAAEYPTKKEVLKFAEAAAYIVYKLKTKSRRVLREFDSYAERNQAAEIANLGSSFEKAGSGKICCYDYGLKADELKMPKILKNVSI